MRRLGLIGLAIAALFMFQKPSFAYEEDTHFLITYILCRSTGFTHQEALTVAAVDQGMDDSVGTVANGGLGGVIPNVPEEWLWHALDHNGNMGPKGVLKRKEELFKTALTRVEKQDKLIYLGVFFHFQQDTWAHRHHYGGSPHSYDAYTTYNTPFGHAPAGHQPDRPPFDPETAMKNLEDGVKYAKEFLKTALGRQPRAFLANYAAAGGKQDDNWLDSRKGKYFHQLKSDGSPGSARKFLTDLIREQINAYSSSIDTIAFPGRFTADEVDFNKVQTAFQKVLTLAATALGDTITLPTKQDKVAQGFTGLTTARLSAAAPVLKNYVVRVKTGTKFLSGTDANVTLVMNGSLRTSEKFVLNPLINGNAFEKGRLDTATLSGVQDVGDIASIKISHNNAGIGPGWYLEYVEIETGGKKKRFVLNGWLDTEKGLSKTIR